MSGESSYWSQLCPLVMKLRCWVRMAWRQDGETLEGYWGKLLIIPTDGYLEAPGGPVPFRNVEWVDVSTKLVKGGVAGRPRELIEVKGELLEGLRGTTLTWELRASTWSISRVFDTEPVEVIRVTSRFGPAPISKAE